MKRRHAKSIVTVAALTLIILFFVWQRYRTQTSTVVSPDVTTGTNQPAAPPQSAIGIVKSAISQNQMMAAIREAESQPIEFYGKVVDQDGQPVPGVEVNYIIYSTPKAPDPGVGKAISGANGEFYVGGHYGARISFALTKDGYLPAEPNSGATFSLSVPSSERYIPDSANPRVLRLWRRGESVQLVQLDQRYACPLLNCSIRIDIVNGKSVPDGGDLEVEFEKGPGSRDLRQNFDWRCTVRPVNGGIKIAASLEEIDTTFEAPAEGYTNKLDFVMSKDSVKWQSGVDRLVYLKSRDGQVFAKFHLSISVNSERTGTIVIRRGVANASASRRLEP